MNNNRTMKKKIVAGMLVATMACSSVATDGFGTRMHEIVKAESTTQNDTENQIYTVNFLAMSGSVSIPSKEVTNYEEYGELPTPTRKGYSFKGWYTSSSQGELITSDSIVNLSSNQNLYARWEAERYRITLDPQGGTVSNSEFFVTYGEDYPELPTPEKGNDTFAGWYTSDGQLVKNGSCCITSENHTLYASWENQYRAASLEDLTYEFVNGRGAFSYPTEYKIPLSSYQYIYGDTVLAEKIFTSKGEWAGNCFGMTSSSVIFHAGTTNLQFKDFNSEANYVKDLRITDSNQKVQLTLSQLIEIMQISQFDSKVQRAISCNDNKLDELCRKVEASQNGNGQPVLIALYGPEGGHAVVGYKIEDDKLYIYDPNFPDTTRAIELKKNEAGKYYYWYYKLNNEHDWEAGKDKCWISYVPYEEYKQVWIERSSDRYMDTSTNVNMLGLSVDNAIIYDEQGNELAQVKDGELETKKEDIFTVSELALEEPGKEEQVALYLPTDTYVIKNTDKENKEFTVDMTHVKQGVSVTTQANQVTFNVNDKERISGASCNVENGQSYSMSLYSSYEDDKKNVEINGTGTSTGEVGISQSMGNLELKNCDMENVVVNGQKTNSYVISAESSEGGKIAFQGTQTITAGNNAIVDGDRAAYVMLPEDGYVLSDVLVDDNSVGAVSTYCFDNVTDNHKIVAVFEKFDVNAISVDEIPSQVHTGTLLTPAVTVRMNSKVLKENIDYSVIYSNNKELGTAKVTIIGLGSYKGLEKTAKFTITAAKGETYTVGGAKYQVTNEKAKEVTFISPVSKQKASISIPKTVKIGVTTYKVTKIAAKAFSGCSKVKKITVKSTYLTSVGSNAFKGIVKNAVIKVPSAKLAKYKKLMKNKGQKKTVKITK